MTKRKTKKARDGVVVIIHDGVRMLVQKKNHSYPIVAWRGRFSLFGGSIENKETTEEALKRELFEELPNGFAKVVLKNITFLDCFTLKRYYQGYYALHVFTAYMRPAQFARWSRILLMPQMVQEGRACIMNLANLALQPSRWIGHLEVVLAFWLKKQRKEKPNAKNR